MKCAPIRSVADNRSAEIIPWPKEVKKPAKDTRPMGDKLEGVDAEERTGRFLNMIEGREG
jgi:hypothetical protein